MYIKMLTSLLAFLMLGCGLSDTNKDQSEYSIKHSFVVEHKNHKSKNISVYLEGNYGNSVTECGVVVKNSQNIATLINYDYTKGCYFGDIPTSVDGKYELTISSSILGKDIKQELYNYIKATYLGPGKQIWEFDTRYHNSTNPIVYGDLVYNVDIEALRAFDKKNGKLIYEDKSLGIDGMRIVGYIPHKGDMIYVMDTNVIKAVRLKDAP